MDGAKGADSYNLAKKLNLDVELRYSKVDPTVAEFERIGSALEQGYEVVATSAATQDALGHTVNLTSITAADKLKIVQIKSNIPQYAQM